MADFFYALIKLFINDNLSINENNIHNRRTKEKNNVG